jgi:integrase
VHDLRHSFACRRLLTWYREGKDVNALLPALATHLGHVRVTSTQVYLRATAELLEEANKRFRENFRQNVL